MPRALVVSGALFCLRSGFDTPAKQTALMMGRVSFDSFLEVAFLRTKHWRLTWRAIPLFLSVWSLQALSPPAMANAQTPADAIALDQEGKLPEAVQAWRAVIQKNPNDAAALASLGVVLSKEQKYKEAAFAYKKAIALNPKLPGVQLNLGL